MPAVPSSGKDVPCPTRPTRSGREHDREHRCGAHGAACRSGGRCHRAARVLSFAVDDETGGRGPGGVVRQARARKYMAGTRPCGGVGAKSCSMPFSRGRWEYGNPFGRDGHGKSFENLAFQVARRWGCGLSGQVKQENEPPTEGTRPCRVPSAATRVTAPPVPRPNTTVPYAPPPVPHGVPASFCADTAPRATCVSWRNGWPRSWWGDVPPKRSVARSRCRCAKNCADCAAVCPAGWPPGSHGCSTNPCALTPWRSAPSSPVTAAPGCSPSVPGGRRAVGCASTWRSTAPEPEKSMDFSTRAPIGSPGGKTPLTGDIPGVPEWRADSRAARTEVTRAGYTAPPPAGRRRGKGRRPSGCPAP